MMWRQTLACLLASLLASCSAIGPDQPLRARASVADPLAPGSHEAVLGGVRFWYRVAGNAPAAAAPVIFLHGGPGGGSYEFAYFAGPELERGLRMVYFDQRGSGRSERPWTGDYTMSTLVEDIERLRAHLGAPRVAIVAHSFGAALALEYGARHPDRVSRMVIAGGLSDAPAGCRAGAERLRVLRPEAYAKAFPHGAAAVLDEDVCERGFRALPGPEREALNRSEMWPNPQTLARFQQVRAESGLRNTGEMSAALFKAGLLKWRFEEMARVAMPVLVIAGEEDHQTGLGPQRALADALPNGRILVYENAGHWMMVDQPERFARDVTAFLHPEGAQASLPSRAGIVLGQAQGRQPAHSNL